MNLRGRVHGLERRAGVRGGVCPQCKNSGEGLKRYFRVPIGEPVPIERCPLCGKGPRYVKVLRMPRIPDGKGGFLGPPV